MTQPARTRFGAYEILHELKSGGMGSVLLARRRGPGAFEQLVAIKTILPEYAATPAVRAMFLDEAAILARTHHPGIATVHDFGEEGATLYMAMEYVAGISMRDVVEHEPPPIVIARAIVEACRGLHAAHELRDLSGAPLGLVHRDISPDNLMLGFDGHVKVIDFGIALVKNRQAPVTEFGSLKGKPPYMSPEQVKNETLDRRSDVFSIGVVLWELLTQKPLFEGTSIYAVALAVQEQVIVPPSQAIGQPLPRGLDAVVMNALERDPARRTKTAADLAEQLEEVIQTAGGETLESWSARVLARARDDHRAWLAGIVAGTELPKAVGRATGEVTEVGPLGKARTALAPIPAVPPRRRLAPLVIALLVLLALGGGAFLALHSHEEVTAPRDAGVPMDVRAVVPVAVDAAPSIDAGIEIDAAVVVPVDAGTRHAVVRVKPDAGVVQVTVKPDAAVATPSPAGSGFVTILYKPGPYANISIDDGPALPGPIFKRKLAAGRHTIKFLDPRSGDVLDMQTVEITDANVTKVEQR
ncbi:MAG TPA: serine/threonine-protein kinase [Kofleriaceae bacterium]|nr:serine/threonine-protein kinase [Kofleriaceae bacterium]